MFGAVSVFWVIFTPAPVARCTTPSFVCTLRLRVNGHDRTVLDARFEAARHVYNACLGEALCRLDGMRQSRTWQKARKIRDPGQRKVLFARARKAHGFERFALINFATGLRRCWPGGVLDSRTVYALATRAFHAVSRIATGQARRVRFKGPGRLRTLEGTDHVAGLRFRHVGPGGRDDVRGYAVCWGGLVLPVRVRHNEQTIRHALGCPIKFIRLLRRRHGTQVRYYVQLVLEGHALPRARPGTERVGLDLNVHHLAFNGETQAGLLPFAPGLQDRHRMVRRLQRKLDRQRRANNPERYNPDGTIAPRRRGPWKVSGRMRVTAARLEDLQRRQKEQRANENGRIANAVVRVGVDLSAEDVSVRGWQRTFGKSVGRRAPAGCLQRIARRAESAGGGLWLFSTRKTRLSQTCICGAVRRKSLSERVHCCPCGVTMQRDLLSAFLARHVEGDVLHAGRAAQAWSAAEPQLSAAWRRYQSATPSGPSARRHRGTGRSGSRSMVASLHGV